MMSHNVPYTAIVVLLYLTGLQYPENSVEIAAENKKKPFREPEPSKHSCTDSKGRN